MPTRLFKKGDKKPPNSGRKKGSLNKVTRDVKEFISVITSDPEVQEAVRTAIIERDRGAVQGYLGFVAHKIGRAKETVEVSASPSLARLLLLAGEEKSKADVGVGVREVKPDVGKE